MRTRTDAALAVAVGLACAATRFAWRGEGLFSWDSGLLASGVREYDFAAGHPHPPYYPLAIALAKVLAVWTTEAQALILLSVLASGLLASFTYAVARGFLGRPASLLAVALVVLSPTALFNGTVALTYALEGASSAAVAWAAWTCRRAEPGPASRRAAIVLAVTLSIAVGIRPSSLFLLGPLALWAVWRRWLDLAWAAGAGAVATLAWLVPAVVAGGGLADFLAGNRYQSRHVVFSRTVVHEGWGVVPENLHWLSVYVPWELPVVVAAVLLAAVTLFLWVRHAPAAPAGSFLAVWLLWPLAFFVFVYAGWPVYPTGYVLVLVPGVAVAFAAFVQSLAHGLTSSGAPRFARALVALALVALVATPVTWAGSWHDATGGQREADAWRSQWWALERDYPSNETALLTFYGWFWARLDHPEYLVWATVPYWNATGDVRVQVVQGQGAHDDRKAYADALDGVDQEPPHPIPDWVRHVVLIHGPPSRNDPYSFKPGLPVQNLTLESGMQVSVLDPTGLASIEQAVLWFDDEGRLLP